MIMKYSQHNIEGYLEKYFPDPGVFLEIGAWDGELISQTAWLERERGWTGVCVDPFPRDFSNRTCLVVPKAISRDGGRREFVRVSIDKNNQGDVSYFSGFRDTLNTHWDMIRKNCRYGIVELQTITLDQMWTEAELPDYVDFLSVDTEGSEREIFESLDFSRRSFGLIVFEHNENREDQRAIGEILKSNGYDLLESLRVDDIYINGDIKHGS